MGITARTADMKCNVCGNEASDARVFENADGTQSYAHTYPARCWFVEQERRAPGGCVRGPLARLMGFIFRE